LEKEEDGYETEGPLADLGRAMSQNQGESGEFSFGGPADFLPSAPGLFIEGVGKVALPLMDDQTAEKIIQVCEQAPFGRGRKTLVDTSVRNSWQLDPAKIHMMNPRWTTGIQNAAPMIAEKFGVKGTPISLHLYKFLLYKKGGHFAKHRDTEKEDRMFATMVVQLPSAHQGGQLQVFKDGSETPVIHDFGTKAGESESQYNYAVHYVDAEHAVTPITEGYRLALVYSICWPAGSAHRCLQSKSRRLCLNRLLHWPRQTAISTTT
jgi:predicted 2-oxoglutarate/Fe(II)-dependent dioxygenase YbiX